MTHYLVVHTGLDRVTPGTNQGSFQVSLVSHGSKVSDLNHFSQTIPLFVCAVYIHFGGSRQEWCVSSMIYSRDTPFWSGEPSI